tara:strand:+ start:1004 stop:1663 length:660 start_codon:yes stop_codon:yes gene_type:complete
MKKSFLWLIVLFITLTTYKPNSNLTPKFNNLIETIKIDNNIVLDKEEIEQKINFLYSENLFFLNIEDIEKRLKKIDFIESFTIKKIYPNKLNLIISEKKPIAILYLKKKKFYISDKGDIINFKDIEIYNNLPTVFGDRQMFFTLYKDLQSIKFPIKKIKSFYFFESNRWDLKMDDGKLIKLPNKDYIYSLKNFITAKDDINLNNYKIFDYRIKDQLILN